MCDLYRITILIYSVYVIIMKPIEVIGKKWMACNILRAYRAINSLSFFRFVALSTGIAQVNALQGLQPYSWHKTVCI